MKITNNDNDKIINGTNDNDTINNYGSRVTILAQGGNDSIWNGLSGRDSLYFDGGDGNDNILNRGNNSTIAGGNGNDSINHSGNGGKIDGGNGNDTIRNYGSNAIVNAGNDDDYIRIEDSNKATVNAGEGNDFISINAYSNNSSVYGGAGDDSIDNASSFVTILGGDGNDSIKNSGSNVTIAGDKGNDLITNSADNVLFNYNFGDGSDLIDGLKANSTLSISGGVYATTIKQNDDIIVTVSEDKITLKGAATLSTVNIVETPVNINNSQNNVTLFATNGDDTIRNNSDGERAVINALGGNDSISNYAANATITSTNGNDSISNYGNRVKISSGAGNDSIDNRASNASIDGGNDNDTIRNSAQNVTIYGGKGNDSITNSADNVLFYYNYDDGNDVIQGFNANSTLSIFGGTYLVTTVKSTNDLIVNVGNDKITLVGAGSLSTANIFEIPVDINNDKSNVKVFATNADDTITNTGEKSTILALNGNDSINNNAANVSIDSGNGNDKVINSGTNVKISARSGNDSISNSGATVSIGGGEGNDSIFNSGTKVTLSGGNDNDTIDNYANANEVLISGNNGDDSINNDGSNVTINGGSGKDSITNIGATVSIFGGNDNDIIDNSGSKVTITGGGGDDTIKLNQNSTDALIIYNRNDGNDVIENFNATSVLQIGKGSGAYTKSISGNDVVIRVNDDKITLKGAASLANVNIVGSTKLIVNNTVNGAFLVGSRLNDSVVNSGLQVTINTYGGKDTIQNYSRQVAIDSGDGNDFIENKNSNSVTINGGNGKDIIISQRGFTNKIVGGSGDDSIDITNSEKSLIVYKLGDGNDIIEGFNNTSRLSIAGGVYSTSKSDNDILVMIGSDKITLKGAASLSALNIIGVEDIHLNTTNKNSNASIYGTVFEDTIGNSGSNVTITALAGNDTIHNGYWNARNSNVTIDAGSGNDSILNEFSANVSIFGGDGNDYIENNTSKATINGGNGNDSIRNTDNGEDTKIFGGAGNDSINNDGSNVTINSGKGDDTIYNNWDIVKNAPGNDDNDNGLNVVFEHDLGDGNDVIYGFKRNSTLNIAGSSYTSQKIDNDVIVTAGNDKITLMGAGDLSTINISTVNSSADNSTADNSHTINPSAIDTINRTNDISLVGTAFNDTIENYGSAVTILAQNGDDYITNKALDTSILGGMGNDSVVNIGSNVTIIAEDGNDYINNYGKFTTINGDNGDDTVENTPYGNNVSIMGGIGNDSIQNKASNVTINGASGSDTIQNYADNVTFEYAKGDGSDLIEGFKTTSSLNITDGTYTLDRVSDDIILTVGDDKITLKGAASISAPNIIGNKGKTLQDIKNDKNGVVVMGTALADTITNTGEKVTISALAGDDFIDNDGTGNETSINAGNGNDTVSNDHSAQDITINAGNGNDSISNNGNNNKLVGGAGNDSIFNDFANFVTMEGGKGDDSINSDGDNALFIYNSGDGNDIIKGFNDTSTLSIAADSYTSAKSGNDVIVTVGNDKITLTGAGKLSAINIVKGAAVIKDDTTTDNTTDNKTDPNTFVAKDNEFIKFTNSDTIPSTFTGRNSGLDFSDYSGTVNVNLANGTFNGQKVTFSGINKLKAGKDNSTLTGSDSNETLFAGSGYTSLYGGKGNDSLVGKGNSSDKNGQTTFYFLKNYGRDTIADFRFITPTNRYDKFEDKIILDENSVSDVHISDKKITIEYDKDNLLTLEDAVGKDFRFNDFIAKVDKDIVYDGLANCYVAVGGTSLTVGENVDSAEIWLDNTHGTLFLGNPIRTLNASNAKGNTSLVGNNFDNTITGGQGDSSLWGNDVGNDLLIGGKAKNTFFYGMGNGNDTIQGANNGDIVNLGDVKLDQISDATITADSVSIKFTDGGSLQINSAADVTYQLADGTKYSANHQNLQWQTK